MTRVLVLYSELAAYFTACLRQFVSEGEYEVHAVRWPINPEAPFQFNPEPGIIYYERRDMSVKDMIELGERIQARGLYVSGWIDKDYLKVARHFRRKGIPCIAAFDTHWRGTLRQWFAVSISPFTIQAAFSHCWVPGLFQYEYARRLGYPREMIFTGMYAADTSLFHENTPNRLAAKAISYPKTFLFVGRLLEFKGVVELCTAFVQLYDEGLTDWKLIMVGNGPMRDAIPDHPAIEIMSFIQPHDLPVLADRGGTFVLPSKYEAWGVVAHEFAAAGLPLILGSEVGAATSFLRPGFNGYSHESGSMESLKWAMKRMMMKTDAERMEMSRRSYILSQQITPQTWSATLKEILELN